MKTLARFAIRPADNKLEKGDLILGAMQEDYVTNLLKPNHVYEIREVDGVLTIADMGESAMGMYPVEARVDSTLRGQVSRVGWFNEIGYLLSVGDGQHLITREEMGR